MNITSCLYTGSVMHRRFQPRIHRFRYRVFWLLIDLSELESLSRQLRLFALNRSGVFSFYEADHGDGSDTPLSVQVTRHLAKAGIDLDGGAIRLFCMPRILGYAFNPLSIYFCYRADGSLAALLYEVSNTFGQRHSYLIPAQGQAGTIHQHCDKAFYVSPFLDMEMSYDFSIRGPAEQIAFAIRANRFGQTAMSASLTGVRKALTDGALLHAFLKIPLLTLKVTAAIHWEALRLWLKGVSLVRRPAPPTHAISTIPTLRE